jgi:hypothetical protein
MLHGCVLPGVGQPHSYVTLVVSLTAPLTSFTAARWHALAAWRICTCATTLIWVPICFTMSQL